MMKVKEHLVEFIDKNVIPALKDFVKKNKDRETYHTHDPNPVFELIRTNIILKYEYRIEGYDVGDEDSYNLGYMADGPQFKFYPSAFYLIKFRVPQLNEEMTAAIESTGSDYPSFADNFYDLIIQTVKEQAIVEGIPFDSIDRRTFPRIAKTTITRKYI